MDFVNLLIYVLTYFLFFITLFFSLLNLIGLFKKEKILKKRLKEWPKVAIIVPAYNEEKNIAETLISLANLDYPKDKLKIICVDDGSKDKTYEVAKKTAEKINKKFPNLIEVYKKENGGKASALNFGINKVLNNVKYIVGMDADSVVAKHSLKKLVEFAENSDEKVMAFVSTMNVYKPKNWLQRIQAIEYYISNFVRKLLHKNGWIYITPGPFSMYKSEFFKKHGLFKEDDITEDAEIGIRIRMKGYKIIFVEDSLVYTKTPETVKSLWKQRLRWFLGPIDDIILYKNYLKNAGELGILILPISLIVPFLIFILLVLVIYKSWIEWLYYKIWALIILKQDIIYLIINYFKNLNFSFQLNDLFFMSFVAFLISLVTFIFSIKYYNNKLDKKWFKNKIALFKNFILMFFIYSILLTFFMASAVYYKIFGKELRFGNLIWRNSLRNKLFTKLGAFKFFKQRF